MNKDYEVRYTLDSYGFETEFDTRSQGNKLTITGYAAVFGARSLDLGGFTEVIEPGTFRKTIKESDVRALWNHNADHVLGRNKAGSLRMAEDTQGLHYEVDLIDCETNRFRYEQIQRGDISQSSFGFAMLDDAWGKVGGQSQRTLREVILFDVSPVAYPAYPAATIGTRALERLARAKNLDLAEVRANLATVISDENTTPVKTTYVVSRYFEPAEVIRIKGRIK